MKNKLSRSCLAAFTLLGLALLYSPEALAQSTASAETIYSYVEEPPAFEGGDAELMNFIASNVQYPQDAKAAGLTGVVILTFVVEKNGTMSNIETMKSLSKSTDAEAIRVLGLSEGKWSIGRQHGKPLRVKQNFVVKYSLDKDGNSTVLHKMPQFKGGQEAMVQAIYSNLKVPAGTQKENINARVQVKFNVEEDGKVSNIAIANTKLKKVVGAGADMDYMDASTFKLLNKATLAELTTAAAEAIQGTSGMWEPGIRHGKPIAAEITLPVLFSSSKELKMENHLEAMLLSYQPDAYDRKFSYKANEVDIPAALKEGSVEKFLAKHLRYPDTSFEGIVKVAFLVADDGRLIGPMTNVNKDEKAIADEFSRVFELTEGNWIPAQKNTQPITAMQEITVEFVTKNGKKNPSRNANVVVTRSK